MKTIARWEDLAPYGIEALTGEACGLNYRLLCDVTAKGKAVLAKFLGDPKLALPPAWNRGSEGDPHVGSVLLVRELLLPLAVFALLEAGHQEAWLIGTKVAFALEEGEPVEESVRVMQVMHGTRGWRRFGYRGTAPGGDRNVHQASGRVF